MSQQSKLRQSRQQWKQKAKDRAEHNRYLRKQLERIRNERDHAKQALKEANKQLRQKEARPTHLKAHRVWLTLTLFARAHISFRAVSRVLHVLAHWLGIGKAPCPQTVINWVTRLSIVRMQSVKLLQGASRHLSPFTNGLIWMIDTSITLGTGKLLSVLALDAHHYQLASCAPGFQHVRCIAVAVSPSWTGERLAELLERVIAVVGRPAAYLKDGGSELKKATDVLSERGLGSPVIDDISHAVANMLKRRYETHPQFATFLSACGRVSSRLKHTVLACLTPPKVQTTSRFMNVHRLVRWADQVRGLLPAGRAKTGSVVAKLRTCLDDLPACRTLIRQFRDDAVALLACQQTLKTRGLTHDTLRECEPLLDTMASVRVRQEFFRSLHHQLETATSLGLDKVGLPISSDPIESLFGLTTSHPHWTWENISIWIATPLVSFSLMFYLQIAILKSLKEFLEFCLPAIGVTIALSAVCGQIASVTGREEDFFKCLTYASEKFLHSSLLMVQSMIIVYVKESLTNFDFIGKSTLLKYFISFLLGTALFYVSTFSAWTWYWGFSTLNSGLWNKYHNRKS